MTITLPEHLVQSIKDYNDNPHKYPLGSLAALNLISYVGEQVARICKTTGELSVVQP